MIVFLVIVGLFLAGYLFLIRPFIRPNKFPPGPFPMPMFGSLPQLAIGYGGDMLAFITEMEKRYGKVFSFCFGSEHAVVVSDFDLYKDAANKEEFQMRGDLGTFGDSRLPDAHGKFPGIMFSNGLEWTEQRRFAARSLKDFGFGTQSMDELVQFEVSQAIEDIQKNMVNKKVSLNKRLNSYVVNALWQIISGERLKYNDPKLTTVVAKVETLLNGINQAGILMLFPWLKYIIPVWSGYKAKNDAIYGMLDLIDSAKKEHEENNEKEGDEQEPRDFIDEYLKHKRSIDSSRTLSSSFYGTRGSDNLRITLVDFFLAGSDTTAATMDWAIMWLCKNPKVMKKMQKQIDSVIGRDRIPSLSDRPNLPYVEAVINEVNRITSLSYITITRSVANDVKMGQYLLPKGTRVFFNLYSIMNDPNYWNNPEEFKPERFIDAATEKFVPDERCVPFGIGRRNCMGKSLAKNELFLFVTAFFQEFNFAFPEDEGAPEIDPSLGVLRTCPHYNVVITPRS